MKATAKVPFRHSSFSKFHFSTTSFSRKRLLIFALLFGLVGGYILLRTFALPNPNLPGDLNGDNTVGITDLSILLSNYGTTNPTADINLDGTVNILDLSILLSHWGQSYSPPTPPGGSGAIDDKRATLMAGLSSTGTPDPANVYGQELNIIQAQSPSNFWTAELFSNNDITLQPDATFGKIYRFRAGPGIGISRNPWWDSDITHNATLNHQRPLTIGQFDWWAMAVKWEVPYTLPHWQCMFQFGYPTITSPPFCIGASSYNGGEIRSDWNAGLVTDSGGGNWNAAIRGRQTLVPFSSYSGKWVRFVVGIKWGSNNDGEMHVLMRADGESDYTERLTRVGVTTWQWGGSRNIPQNPSGFVVNDKLDLYEGWDGALTDATMPTNYVDHTGDIRAADKATAMSYFP